MTVYARLHPETLAIDAFVDLSDAQLAALNGNPKAALLRAVVDDKAPEPGASQNVEFAGYTVEPKQVRKTWRLVEKSPQQLDAEAAEVEHKQLAAMAAALSADIQTGVTAPPATAAQAFEHIQDLKRRQLRADRILRLLFRSGA